MDTEAIALFVIFLAVMLVAAAMLAWSLAFLIAPGVCYLTHKIEARPTLVPTPLPAFPAEARRYVAASVEALEARGFSVTAWLSVPRCVPGLQAYAVTMLSSSTLDQAQVTIIFSQGAQPQLKARYIEFSTRYASGLSVDTLNSPWLGAFAHGPEAVKTYLPHVSDLRVLYRMHRHICRACTPRGVAIGPEEGGEDSDGAAFLERTIIEDCREQERRGLLLLDEANGVFRPTFKGACWMCWSQLWPFSAVRRARARDAAARRLSGFREDILRGYQGGNWRAGEPDD